MLYALAALTLIRLLVAASVPLSPDEAYYWVWSRALAPGYLDHPPMVALWIRAGTLVLGDASLGVRALAPVSAAAGSWLLAQAAEDLFPGRRLGGPAAILLNATLLLGAGAVTMTPDTPLIFFWTATLAALARLSRSLDGRWWLAVGVAAGAAMDSKYTGALLGAGILIWLVLHGRSWLGSAWLWAGGALAAMMTAPVVAWNAAHHWASFAKQAGRTGVWHPADALAHMGELVAGQIGLATPLVFLLMVGGTALAIRRWREPSSALLAAMIVPGALVFAVHAVGDRVQANWPAILYPAAAIAAAASGRHWRWAAATGAGLTGLVYLQASLAPLPPTRLDPSFSRLAGWGGLARGLDLTEQDRFIAAENYGIAALLAWYRPGTRVIAAEARWALFDLPDAPAETGLLLIPARRDGPDPALWSAITPLGSVSRGRDGVEAERYRLYRVTLRAHAPAKILPHPGDH